MIIDVHNHLGEPWGTTYRQTPSELLGRMDRNSIDKAVVFPFPFNNFDNGYVVSAVRDEPDRLIGFVMVSPWSRDDDGRPIVIRDYIKRHVEDHGFRGVKMHAAAHGYKMSELAVVGPIYEACADMGLPILAYSGDEWPASPLQFLIAAQEFPTVSFVMAHSGFMQHTADSILVAERCPNVYLEQSSAISLGMAWSVEVLGADRVIFGSDSPHMEPEVEIYKAEVMVPDEAQRALILGGNAARLLGLETESDHAVAAAHGDA